MAEMDRAEAFKVLGRLLAAMEDGAIGINGVHHGIAAIKLLIAQEIVNGDMYRRLLQDIVYGCWDEDVEMLKARASDTLKKNPTFDEYSIVHSADLARLREQADTVVRHGNEEVWYWQPDGGNSPESLTCPVIMSAGSLRQLLGEADEARGMCHQMLSVFEAARPLVLNLERLRDISKKEPVR